MVKLRDLILSTFFGGWLQDQSPSHRGMIDMDKKGALVTIGPKRAGTAAWSVNWPPSSEQGIFDQPASRPQPSSPDPRPSYEFFPNHGDCFLAKEGETTLPGRYPFWSFLPSRIALKMPPCETRRLPPISRHKALVAAASVTKKRKFSAGAEPLRASALLSAGFL